MGPIGRAYSLAGRLIARARPRDHHPLMVRRVSLSCPHGHGPVEADLLMGPAATPVGTLRCSARCERPPSCDQACRFLDGAAAGPYCLLILPPGTEIEP